MGYTNIEVFIDGIAEYFGVDCQQFTSLYDLGIDLEELKDYLYGKYTDEDIIEENIEAIRNSNTLYEVYNSIMR